MSPRNRRRLLWGVCVVIQVSLLAVAANWLGDRPQRHTSVRGWPLVWMRSYPPLGPDGSANTHHNWAVPLAAGALAVCTPAALLGPLARRVGPKPRPAAGRFERAARAGLSAGLAALGFALIELETAPDARGNGVTHYPPSSFICEWIDHRFPPPPTPTWNGRMAVQPRRLDWTPRYRSLIESARGYRTELFGLDWNDPPGVQWGRRQDYTLAAGAIAAGGGLVLAGRPWRHLAPTTPPPA